MSARSPGPTDGAPEGGDEAETSAGTAPAAHDLILVSDLHMASARDPATGRPARTEDFARDGAFARFLRARAAAQAERGRPWRLVILGDLFDFARVELGRPGEDRRRLDTSTGAALAKLDLIAAGHPEVLEALRDLLSAGVGIDVVPGNHDLELARPAVQRRLRNLLEDAGPEGGGRIEFHPWILHLPGVLYAEHGHQHHDINAAPQLVGTPEVPDADALEAPLGSQLGEYISRVLEVAEPDAERLDPDLARLAAALRARPGAAIATWRAHLAFAHALARHALRVRRAGFKARRAVSAEGRQRRAPVGASGLAPASIEGLDRLAATTLAGTARRLFCMAVASRAPARARPAGPPPSNYLPLAVAAVDRVLREHGDHVPFYVFGHTHAAERSSLGCSPTDATYLNTGTWSELVRGDAARQTFVEIEVEPTAGPAATLLTWDETRGQATPVG